MHSLFIYVGLYICLYIIFQFAVTIQKSKIIPSYIKLCMENQITHPEWWSIYLTFNSLSIFTIYIDLYICFYIMVDLYILKNCIYGRFIYLLLYTGRFIHGNMHCDFCVLVDLYIFFYIYVDLYILEIEPRFIILTYINLPYI